MIVPPANTPEPNPMSRAMGTIHSSCALLVAIPIESTLTRLASRPTDRSMPPAATT
jgi:hypothetical protein